MGREQQQGRGRQRDLFDEAWKTLRCHDDPGAGGTDAGTTEERQAPAAGHGTRALPQQVMEEVASSANLNRAYKRVKANRGAPGIDGMTVPDLLPWIATNREALIASLLDGSDQPQPVRGVEIPKPGGGVRQRGIPTVVDRLVQQALLQVLEPILDPTFSASSFGFRPERSAHHALHQARNYVADGYEIVVDIDLEKVLDCTSDYPPCPVKPEKRSGKASGTLILKPFRRPWQIWTACRSPRLTRCKMVWRETPRRLVASIMGMKPGGAFSTKRASRSSVTRICQGAPGVGCSAGMKPSSIQRRRVDGVRPNRSAALRTVTGSPFCGSVGAFGQGMPR